MCGRFTLTTLDFDELARVLDVTYDPELAARHRPRYNVPPGDSHWIVTGTERGRTILPARWGLGEKRLPLARGEVAARQFKRAFAGGRCLVPADGFFEWTGEKGARVPHWFHPAGPGRLLLLAGLSGEGPHGFDFALLTTRPNATVAPVHDRMPVIVSREAADVWLRGAPDEALSLIGPAPDELLVDTIVSTRVNSARNDDPACLEPAAEPAQRGLF